MNVVGESRVALENGDIGASSTRIDVDPGKRACRLWSNWPEKGSEW